MQELSKKITHLTQNHPLNLYELDRSFNQANVLNNRSIVDQKKFEDSDRTSTQASSLLEYLSSEDDKPLETVPNKKKKKRRKRNRVHKLKTFKHKTEPCKNFMSLGYCVYGKECFFAHDLDELSCSQKNNNETREDNSLQHLENEKEWQPPVSLFKDSIDLQDLLEQRNSEFKDNSVEQKDSIKNAVKTQQKERKRLPVFRKLYQVNNND